MHTSNNNNTKRHHRHPAEATAYYLGLGLASLSTSLTTRYGAGASIDPDVKADLLTMARFNALRSFTYNARIGDRVLATWGLRFGPKGYRVVWPRNVASPTVLRNCTWTSTVRQDQAIAPTYQHLLRVAWGPSSNIHTNTRIGTVQGMASFGRPAIVRSGNLRYDLMLAEAKVQKTRHGDTVEFVPQLQNGRRVAHIVRILKRAAA